MLDLRQVAGQIPALTAQLRKESQQYQRRLDSALQLWQKALSHQLTYQQWQGEFPFSCALPCEPLANRHQPQPLGLPHCVLATDGSQIAPSRHESVYCYLINIGRVAITYGTGTYPLLDSVPEVYYQPDDLYRGRQWGISTEDWIKWQRAIAEFQHLAHLATHLSDPSLPILALTDGSLIFWELENLPRAARQEILTPIWSAWSELRSQDIPLVGYISAPRAVESVNFLRLPACPHATPDCAVHCADLALENLPCGTVHPLRDSSLWAQLLEVGEFSPLWQSRAAVLKEYPAEHTIYFGYLRLGNEIARLEMPAWTASDPQLFNLALQTVVAQVQKGYGYPVALAEAHNQAVVSSGDRQRFFLMLQRYLQQSGMTNLQITNKESRKRSSIA
jgi:hypothetical protein